MQSPATIAELILKDGLRMAYVLCEQTLIPAPGRYLQVHADDSEAPVAAEIFLSENLKAGFLAAPPIPVEWRPGSVLNCRGPLGHGFELPASARRVALIAHDTDSARLRPLAEMALEQGAEVALVCADPPSDLPLSLEVHPPQTLDEICDWCDYVAFDMVGDSRVALYQMIGGLEVARRAPAAQVLIRVPMPCGGIAECGVCSIRTTAGPKLACVDGPVFDLRLLQGKG